MKTDEEGRVSMGMKIAVFTDLQGNVTDFFKAVSFTIFEKKQGWEKMSVIELEPIPQVQMGTVRREAQYRSEVIKGCEAIVAEDLSGIPFSTFDRAGYCIFIARDLSDELFSSIESEIENLQSEKRDDDFGPRPSAEEGCYFLDLIKLQAEHPEVTSKKALKPFLETVSFWELRIKCSHIPPWIEREGLWDITETGPSEYRIQKKTCES